MQVLWLLPVSALRLDPMDGTDDPKEYLCLGASVRLGPISGESRESVSGFSGPPKTWKTWQL